MSKLNCYALLLPFVLPPLGAFANAPTPDYASCRGVNNFRGTSEPTRWVAVCTEVVEGNIKNKAKENVDEAEFCIAEKNTNEELSALGPGSAPDPLGTKYYSVYGLINNWAVYMTPVDFTSYQGSPAGAAQFPLSVDECARHVTAKSGKPLLRGACDLGDRVVMHDSMFRSRHFLTLSDSASSLTFFADEPGEGWPGLEPLRTTAALRMACRPL